MKDVESDAKKTDFLPNHLISLELCTTSGEDGAKRMSATHIEDGDDGRVLPANDVGDVLGLGHLGGYQLERKQLETWSQISLLPYIMYKIRFRP